MIKKMDASGKASTRPSTTEDFYSVSADSVSVVWVKRTDAGKTVLAFLVVAVVVAAVIAVIAAANDEPDPPPSTVESCPFAYSYDGAQFIFDAQPLGGAVCHALQRTDYSRMEHMVPDGGRYRLKLRNEMDETQYLDQIRLYVVDHAPGEVIVPDTTGKMHIISNAIPPEKAIDEDGRDILPFITADDGLPWQSLMTADGLTATPDTRHHLTLEFPKPPEARTAYIVYNTGTTLWGSFMIREMIQARGSTVDEWYRAVDGRGSEFWDLMNFTFREELYVMKMHLLKDGTRIQRGLVFGGGPYITEDRFFGIDVSDISGDKLQVTLDPPKGFWSIDYFAIQYDYDSTLTPQPCELVMGQDQMQNSIVGNVQAEDGAFYVMPERGDWADLSFAVPRQAVNRERSIFLKTTGYYELHIDRSQPPQTALIDSILRNPGSIAEYSTQKYLDGYRQLKQGRYRP
jgi:hypothetical protein